jgi:hypothetical protein
MIGSPDLWPALLPVVDALEALDVPYHVGGSIASSFVGIARATQDADLVADLRPPHAAPFVQALGARYYADRERIDHAIQVRRSFNVIHLVTMYKVAFVGGKPGVDQPSRPCPRRGGPLHVARLSGTPVCAASRVRGSPGGIWARTSSWEGRAMKGTAGSDMGILLSRVDDCRRSPGEDHSPGPPSRVCPKPVRWMSWCGG